MKTTHEDKHCRNRWERIGTKINLKDESYTTNCNMTNGMSFDDMRLTMFNNEEIRPYELGKASAEEMIKVLSYATKYYQLDQKVPKQMIK